MKMNRKIWALLLFVGLMITACNNVKNQPSLSQSMRTVENVDSLETSQFQEFVNYFEVVGLPVEVFHNSYIKSNPIPKDLAIKYLGYEEENDVYPYMNLPLAMNHIALVTSDQTSETDVHFELYIYDRKGAMISMMPIAGIDSSWLGMCVFGDNALFRVEDRTPDMDEDESEALSTRWYKIDDNGKIEALEM